MFAADFCYESKLKIKTVSNILKVNSLYYKVNLKKNAVLHQSVEVKNPGNMFINAKKNLSKKIDACC